VARPLSCGSMSRRRAKCAIAKLGSGGLVSFLLWNKASHLQMLSVLPRLCLAEARHSQPRFQPHRSPCRLADLTRVLHHSRRVHPRRPPAAARAAPPSAEGLGPSAVRSHTCLPGWPVRKEASVGEDVRGMVRGAIRSTAVRSAGGARSLGRTGRAGDFRWISPSGRVSQQKATTLDPPPAEATHGPGRRPLQRSWAEKPRYAFAIATCPGATRSARPLSVRQRWASAAAPA